MVEMLLRAAIIVVILVVIWVLATWALGMVGITIPPIIAGAVIAILILVGLLWLWKNRGSLGL
jgi:hypothetical protein